MWFKPTPTLFKSTTERKCMQLRININLSNNVTTPQQVEAALNSTSESIGKLFSGSGVQNLAAPEFEKVEGHSYEIMSNEGINLGNYQLEREKVEV